MTERAIKGLTLVELMLALALSLLLVAAVGAFFVSQKTTYNAVDAVGDLQQKGRIAMELLTQDVRLAGYQGCADPDGAPATLLAQGYGGFTFTAGNLQNWAVEGYEADAAGWSAGTEPNIAELDGALGGDELFERAAIDPDGHRDVLVVRYMDTGAVDLTDHDQGNDALVVPAAYATTMLPQNALVVVSDCEVADVFFRTNAAATGTVSYAGSTNIGTGLTKIFDPPDDTEVGRLFSAVYYVGDTDRDRSDGSDILALYRKLTDTNDLPAEIISGVERMDVQYGQEDGVNFRFFDADDAGIDMTRVVAVRIALLVASERESRSSPDDTVYVLNGNEVGPFNDRLLRRVFTETITIRNRRREF